MNASTSDECHSIIARNSHVYHTSTKRIYQSWPKGSLNTPTDTLTTLSTGTINAFSVSEAET